MRLLYAVLCEEATARDDGRLDVLGIFHQLYAPGFPAKQDRMVLALSMEWEAGEEGEIEFQIDLLDPSGSPSLTISGGTEVPPRTPGEAPPQTRLIMPLEGVVFPAAGSYLFELKTRGQALAAAPLHLIENPDA